MGTLEDFLHYLRGHKLLVLDAAVVGVAAWYDPHTAVVALFCTTLLFAVYSLDLVGRLALDGAATRGEISEAKKELEEKIEGEVADVRRESCKMRKTEELGNKVDAALGEKVDEVAGELRGELSDAKSELHERLDALADKAGQLVGAIQGDKFLPFRGLSERTATLEELSHAFSHDLRILRDAIEGIDPRAVRTMEDISWWDNHAGERHEDHARGVQSLHDRPEPSVARLEKEIEELKRRIQGGGT